MQRWLLAGAVSLSLAALGCFTAYTMFIAIPLALLSLMTSLATVILSIARGVNDRRALTLRRLATVERLIPIRPTPCRERILRRTSSLAPATYDITFWLLPAGALAGCIHDKARGGSV